MLTQYYIDNKLTMPKQFTNSVVYDFQTICMVLCQKTSRNKKKGIVPFFRFNDIT